MLFELVQRRIQRPVAHLQDGARNLFEAHADRVAVHRLEREDLEQQQIQRALHQVRWFAHRFPSLTERSIPALRSVSKQKRGELRKEQRSEAERRFLRFSHQRHESPELEAVRTSTTACWAASETEGRRLRHTGGGPRARRRDVRAPTTTPPPRRSAQREGGQAKAARFAFNSKVFREPRWLLTLRGGHPRPRLLRQSGSSSPSTAVVALHPPPASPHRPSTAAACP